MNKKQWIKLIESAAVNGAALLNPEAAGLIFLLKLCFQLWVALPDAEPTQNPTPASQAKECG